MAKVNLGEKQACPECEKKFYDLTKHPAVCPYCAFSFDPSDLAPKPQAAPSNVDENAKDDDKSEEEDVDVDEDEAAAKELELDGDSANFGGDSGDDEDGDNGQKAPDMDGFQSSDDDDESSAEDESEDDALPPTQKEGEEPEEVEI